MYKFLHAADFHIDSPLIGLDAEDNPHSRELYHARSLVEVSKCLELQRQYGIKFLAMGLMVL